MDGRAGLQDFLKLFGGWGVEGGGEAEGVRTLYTFNTCKWYGPKNSLKMHLKTVSTAEIHAETPLAEFFF